MQPFMTYNEAEGVKSGAGMALQTGGAHVIQIELAQYVESSAKATKGIEFSGKTQSGEKVKYLTVYYQKSNEEMIPSGQSCINALMGLIGLPSLSFSQVNIGTEQIYHVPEFKDKVVGLFLQKRLTSKQDGTDSYGFDIVCPFDPKTKATLKEKVENKQPQTIARMSESYKDKDERSKQQSGRQQGGHSQHQQPQDQFDDIDFA